MFDPLHKWLGIPPHEQPPNHYRLLGLATFESDPDVIDAAADKQLTFLHDLTNGEYAEEAEQLSNQVSAARLCLLNKQKKQAYDDSLLHRPERMLPPATIPLDVPQPVVPELDAYEVADVSAKTLPTIHGNRSPKKRAKRSLWFYSLLPCLIALGLVGIGLWTGRFKLDFKRLEPLGIHIATKSDDAAESPQDLEPPGASQQTSPRNTDPAQTSVSESRGSSSAPRTPATDTKPKQPNGNLSDPLNPQPGTPNQIIKQPHPTDEELEKKRALIRELYQDEYRKAKTSAEKIELGKLMHREGQSTTDDPVGRFELWRIARDVLSREGEFALALAIVDNLEDHYTGVDSTNLKAETLLAASSRVTPARTDDFVHAVESIVDQCQQDERFDLGVQLVNATKKEIRTRVTDEIRAQIDRIATELQFVQQSHDEYLLALETLAKVKDDPLANQQVGRYLAIVRRQWDQGLKHLALGSDPQTRAAAVTELTSQSDSSASLAIADAWYDVSQVADRTVEQQNLQHHAFAWYQRAEDETTGLEQKKVRARIAELQRVLPADDLAADGETQVVPTALLGYRVKTSADSHSDFARRQANVFDIGMGARADGRGEAMGGVELQGIKQISVTGGASHRDMVIVDAASKSGFFIDYHTPGGYAKRVFLGLGLEPNREFNDSPPWGTEKSPDIITDLGRATAYQIDLTRWAPTTWDGRCWFTIYMQNAGANRSLNATITW
jgi:hypothetical protein